MKKFIAIAAVFALSATTVMTAQEPKKEEKKEKSCCSSKKGEKSCSKGDKEVKADKATSDKK